MPERAERRDGDAEVIEIAAERAAREAAGRGRCAANGPRACRNLAVEAGLCRVHARAAARAAGHDARADDARGGDARADDARGGDARAGGARRAADPTGPDDGSGPDARPRDEGPPADDLPPADPDGWARLSQALDVARLLLGARWPGLVDDATAFLRRRLAGDYEVDEFGFDVDLTEHVLVPLVRPLHRHYWRVASHGLEHLPAEGGAMLVANHAGTLPADAVIMRFDVLEHTGRHVRELGADLVFRTPFVGELARKTGVTLADGGDAERLLARGEMVAVWPEGFKGIGKPWKERYRLQRFGRGGFVATALRAQVPIVPTAIIGSEEIYPLLHDARILARLLGLPYFPIVPQMLALPVLGPLALLPLPSKWLIEYGEPIDTTAYGPEAADDPMVVFDLTDRVRSTIQRMIDRNLTGRTSVFL